MAANNPPFNPQVQFLLRGSLLLAAMLTLWWLILLNPLLLFLRIAADIPLGWLPGATSADPIRVEPSGDWTCRIPVQAAGAGMRIRSIEFTVPRSDVILFTFSLPVYWAIVLAAPAARKAVRPLLWGTALVAAVEVLALVLFVVIAAQTVVAGMRPEADALGHWWREFGNYLTVNVVPPVAPFLIGLSLLPELRSSIFSTRHSTARPGQRLDRRVRQGAP
jgi:hypothetical protein